MHANANTNGHNHNETLSVCLIAQYFPYQNQKTQYIFVTGHMTITVKTIPSPVSFIFLLLGTVGWGEVLRKIHDQISQMPHS